MNRSWLYVIIGAVFEVLWVIGLKHAQQGWEWLGTLLAIYLSFQMLVLATKRLAVGTVYAVFTGLGAAGTVMAEMLVFGEPFELLKILFITLLLTGVIGLKIVTGDAEEHKGANT